MLVFLIAELLLPCRPLQKSHRISDPADNLYPRRTLELRGRGCSKRAEVTRLSTNVIELISQVMSDFSVEPAHPLSHEADMKRERRLVPGRVNSLSTTSGSEKPKTS